MGNADGDAPGACGSWAGGGQQTARCLAPWRRRSGRRRCRSTSTGAKPGVEQPGDSRRWGSPRRCSRRRPSGRRPISGGSGCFRAMSLTARRPPGFSTRAISRNTAGLSGARLMTQLQITQSTEASGSGSVSIVARWNSTFVSAGLRGVAAGQVDHLRRHVDADRLAGRPDLPGRQEHVQPAAAAEVDDRLARLAGSPSRSGCRTRGPCWPRRGSRPAPRASSRTPRPPPGRRPGRSTGRWWRPSRTCPGPPPRSNPTWSISP